MRTRTLLDVVVSLVLACLVVGLAVEVADHLDGTRLEWGRAHLIRLDESTQERLDTLADDVFITYYCSPRERMPSHMRRLERDVTELLTAMKDGSHGRLDFQIVDPTDDPDLEQYASRRKVAPVRERHVTRDSYSEQEVWSTLTIAYGPHPPAMIHGLTPDHLPRLQALIVQHLDQLENPRRPVFAVMAPQGFTQLALYLSERGEVIDVDPASDAPLPEAADVLFVLDPRRVDAGRVLEFQRWLDTGRSLVVAGSPYDADLDLVPGHETLILKPNGFDADAFWDAFGLRPVDGLVMDERSAALPLGDHELAAPFRITCIATNHDFHSMAFEPNGTFVFVAPTPLQPDGERLSELGWTAETLASTSDGTWMLPVGDGRIPFADMGRGDAPALAKQPLVTWLRPRDPWRGSVVALANSTPFRDEMFTAEGVAHRRLAQVIADTLGAPDRLVVTRADVHRPEPLPELPADERVMWRLLCILLVPLLMGLAALVRGGRAALPSAAGLRRALGFALPLVAASVLVGWLASSLGGRSDWTAEGLNSLHPTTRALAAQATGAQAVTAEILFSPPEQMPPAMRGWSQRIVGLLDAMAAEGAQIDVQQRVLAGLSDDEAAQLAARGVEPHKVTSSDEEVTTVRSVYSSLVLHAGERAETLTFRDPRSLETLEFRLAFALWRLQTGKHPKVGFASDVPRLSAAEAHQFYQQQGLIAPQGKDVYSLARAAIEDADFDLVHINPRVPELPDDLDAIVWLQPRRPSTPMLMQLVDYLYKGGSAMLAAQHFNIQSRQYRGAGFEFVYWPQPQSPDVELYWFPEFGFDMVRQVLFDEVSTRVSLESQVNRTMRRDFDTMQSARPFNIRASASDFDPTSPFTKGLGDQAFLWAAPFRWDDEQLAKLGLHAQTLITTSPHSWMYDWSGGWLPDDVLAGPPKDDAGEPQWAGRLPLAVLLSGQFPWPKASFERLPVSVGPDGVPEEQGELAPYPVPEPKDEAAPGRLLFLGCSEPFKDVRLTDPLLADFRGDQLLLNSVTELALPPELAAVMSRRPVARGFGVIDDGTREDWRMIVVLVGPAVLLAFALLRRLFARRAPVFPVTAS
ncbi:MAG: Gldg family protein [Planctomycetes bacterium]|nr:Gldg family protein [Planctomycetota bacterium]